MFANASLFHVPRQELPRVLMALHATLRPNGVLFSSNPRGATTKVGTATAMAPSGICDTWREYMTAAGFVEITHFYRPAGLPREQQPWLASVWRKPAS